MPTCDTTGRSSLSSVSEIPQGSKADQDRLIGIDSLRFVCAFVVLLGHFSLSGERLNGNLENGITRIAIGIWNCLFNGPAAVIVFFVVSGLCIHFPYRSGRPVMPLPFYSRRFLRIIPPALFFIGILKLILKDDSSIQETVLWSVLCEAVYYLIYPLLFAIRKRSSWALMIGVSYACAAIGIVTHLSALQSSSHSYTALGFATWIVGLPCWLLGCWLAENYQRFAVLGPAQIWIIRAAIFSISVVLRLAKFHIVSAFGSNCILLDPFAILVCAWVGLEIVYAQKHAPSSILESAGRWSYSLYLVHPLVIPLLALTGIATLGWYPKVHLLLLLVALGASYLFYLAVESPSHRLAVWVGRFISKRRYVPVQLI